MAEYVRRLTVTGRTEPDVDWVQQFLHAVNMGQQVGKALEGTDATSEVMRQFIAELEWAIARAKDNLAFIKAGQ